MSEEGERLVATADIPRDQRFSFKITPLPGRLLDLATVGGSMHQLAKLHAAIGKDIDGGKWKSCITGCELENDGSFRVDIAVLPIKKSASASEVSDDR